LLSASVLRHAEQTLSSGRRQPSPSASESSVFGVVQSAVGLTIINADTTDDDDDNDDDNSLL